MMRRKLVSRLTAVVATLFCFTCFYLYINAGQREPISKKLLNQVGSVNDKGMKLGMDWLKQVNDESSGEKKIIIESKESNVLPRPPHHAPSLKVSEIVEQLDFSNPPGGVWKQGFPITCPTEELAAKPIEVFIVPHSHQDPGWVRTYDDYFEEKTKPCLDSTLKVLTQRPDARFTYAEVSFFNSWVNTLDVEQKKQVAGLLRDRRLEIASGGWVMSDEGTTHFAAILDQLIEGQHWLNDNFGYLPKTGWVIDTFGHSTSMAYLVNKLHIRGHVIHRIHYELKRYLAQRKAMEFNWHQAWDLDGHTNILTHVLPFYAYDIPHTCGPDPAVCCQFDFARSHSYARCPWRPQVQLIRESNVAERAQLLADQYCQKATLFGDTRVLLIPLGDDFRYTKTSEWDVQLDNYKKLISYWDAHPNMGIKARFAVLSDYFDALKCALESNMEGTTSLAKLSGDLFPYADRNQDYWTGYFTSKPVDKALARQLQSELSAADLLYAHATRAVSHSSSNQPEFTEILDSVYDLLTEARRTLGLLQHHDSITGTAKSFVVEDYALRRSVAFKQTRLVSRLSLTILLLMVQGDPSNNPALNLIKAKLNDTRFNISRLDTYLTEVECLETQSFWSHSVPSDVIELTSVQENKFVLLYNPTPYRRTVTPQFVIHTPVTGHSIRVSHRRFSVFTPVAVQTQQNPADSETTHVGPIVLEPLSVTALKFELTKERKKQPEPFVSELDDQSIVFRNNVIELHFNAKSGLMERIVNIRTGLEVKIDLDFVQYRSATKSSNSGAYLFVPDGPEEPLVLPSNVEKHVTRGPLFDQLVLYTNYVNHTVRLYKDDRPLAESIEIQNQVNISEKDNMELVLRIRTDIGPTSPYFYTDSNCFQFIERSYHSKLPLQGNVYPMTCAAFIQSTSPTAVRLTLLSSYTLGVTSPQSGQLLIWLDRRAPKDDNRGVAEPLLGSWSVVSKFNLVLESIQVDAKESLPTVPRLTLRAYLALMELTHPVQRFSVSPELGSLPDLNMMVHGILPCDYELVSLRVLSKQFLQSPPVSTKYPLGLWLHRLPGFTNSQWIVDLPESVSPCKLSPTINTEQLTLKHIFPALRLSLATKLRRITLVPEPNELFHWRESLSVEPMELDGFLVR